MIDGMKKIQGIILSKTISLMIFLVGLVIINNIESHSFAFRTVVQFINANAVLLIIMSLIMMIAEVCFAFMFPFNLVAPIFSAVGSIYLVTFIIRVFGLIDTLSNVRVFAFMFPLAFLIYPLVFIIVFILGYVNIFIRLFRAKRKEETNGWKERKNKKGQGKSREKSWDDIGNEFKTAMSDFFRKVADSIEKK